MPSMYEYKNMGVKMPVYKNKHLIYASFLSLFMQKYFFKKKKNDTNIIKALLLKNETVISSVVSLEKQAVLCKKREGNNI